MFLCHSDAGRVSDPKGKTRANACIPIGSEILLYAQDDNRWRYNKVVLG